MSRYSLRNTDLHNRCMTIVLRLKESLQVTWFGSLRNKIDIKKTYLKNIFGRLFENPSFSVIIWNHFHGNRKISVANENVDWISDTKKRFWLPCTLFGNEWSDECQSKHSKPSRFSHNTLKLCSKWNDWSSLQKREKLN